MIASTIIKTAKAFDLDIKLVAAIIMQESSGNPWATRFEPNFYAKYIANKSRATLPGFVPSSDVITITTEKYWRATSFGAMQIMGETAREAGYYENELVKLLDPEIGINWGCKYFAKCMKLAKGSEERALLFYNGGGNLEYPKLVKNHITNGNIYKVLEYT